jgi:thymidine phosphorylase
LKVADAKETLEKALQMSQRLYELTSSLREWLTTQTKELSNDKKPTKRVKNVVDIAKEMTTVKRLVAEDILE